jgi:redox-sensitive bicupin YhaK (pirin superfamily)
MGTGAVIRPGELQHMTAGSGILHSEFNPSPKDPTHLLQIWIMPDRKNRKPEYEQLAFPDKDLHGKFLHVAGPEAPVTIHQDANLFIARLGEGQEAKVDLQADRHAWVQVARGGVAVNGRDLRAGDGAAISKEEEVRVKAKEASEVLLFDLA